GARDQPLREEPAVFRVRLLAVVVQGDVLGQAEVEDEAAELAVFGDMAAVRVEALTWRVSRQVVLADTDPARLGPPEAGDRIDQFGLAVAVHPGDADDLPRLHVERDAPNGLEPTLVVDVEILDREERRARLRLRFVDAEDDLAPDHEPGEAFLRRAFAWHGVDGLTAAPARDCVRDLC